MPAAVPQRPAGEGRLSGPDDDGVEGLAGLSLRAVVRQLLPGLLAHHVRGVPVGPVRVALPDPLLVLAVGGLGAPSALARSFAEAKVVSPGRRARAGVW